MRGARLCKKLKKNFREDRAKKGGKTIQNTVIVFRLITTNLSLIFQNFIEVYIIV